ncbi:MAG: cbb3-type cytochrome c oxidase subunit 3 [Sphingomonadales bacterium]|nr:cbb3-type cytochrome c oxidase subunit 3 [Sphingomonadales bacterium]
MSVHSTYDTLRHLADSWGLVAMSLVFLGLCAWPFRPGARDRNHTAATMIFEEDDNG